MLSAMNHSVAMLTMAYQVKLDIILDNLKFSSVAYIFMFIVSVGFCVCLCVHASMLCIMRVYT